MNSLWRRTCQRKMWPREFVGSAAPDRFLQIPVRLFAILIALQLLLAGWLTSPVSVMATPHHSTLKQESLVQAAPDRDDKPASHLLFLPALVSSQALSSPTMSACRPSSFVPGQPVLCDDMMQPPPDLERAVTAAQGLDHRLAVIYALPADVAFDPLVLEELVHASREIQRWYQVATGGVTWQVASAEIVLIYHAARPRQYYVDTGNWWGSLLPEMAQAGLPVWRPGTVLAIWAQGAGWWAGAAQGCAGECGVALLGVELFPQFNNPAFSGEQCPDPDGLGIEAWPCVPLGAFAHELGHTLGLPHPADLPETEPVAWYSVMQTHWNYPSLAPEDGLPWGFLCPERHTLWANPFMTRGIALRQTYQALDTDVNLPPEGTLPAAAFDVAVNGHQVSVSNHTQGATRYYWTFGDYHVSNEVSPDHTFTAPGSYVLMLRASSDSAMMGVASRTVVIAADDLIFADGFESGKLSKWSAAHTDRGDLKVQTGAALVGSYGLRASIDDNHPLFVTDEHPSAERHYRARFYFDPNAMAMTSGDNHFLFYGYGGVPGAFQRVLRVQFRFSSGSYQLRTALLDDGSTWTTSRWFPISDAVHFIEVDWQAATAAGANNGALTVWIDGVQKASFTAADNDTRRIDRVRLGAVAGIDSGTRGTYYLDAFESRRQTYIGPAAGAQVAAAAPTGVDPAELNVWTEEEDVPEENAPEESSPHGLYLPLLSR